MRIVEAMHIGWRRYDWDTGTGMMGGWYWSGWMGAIVMLLIWALIIAGLALLIRWLLSAGRKKEDSALETLRQRYARGEISREEFQEKKKDLGG
jgi:putative membrane protein